MAVLSDRCDLVCVGLAFVIAPNFARAKIVVPFRGVQSAHGNAIEIITPDGFKRYRRSRTGRGQDERQD